MTLALGLGTYFLYALVFVLLLAVLFSALKVLSMVFKLRGKRLFDWNHINGLLFLVFMVAFLAFVFWQFYAWGEQIMLPGGAEHGAEIDQLFMVTTWITMFVFVITHIALFYFAYKYRGRKDREALFYPENNKLEIVWTIIPAIVLTCLITYGFILWTDLTQEPPAEEDATVIELYAYQFGWKARYPGPDEKLGTFDYTKIQGANDLGLVASDVNGKDDKRATEIWLPKGKPVLFKFRAQDVIHSAYMPHFRAQMNVVPGMPTQFYFTPDKTTEEIRKVRNEYDFDYLLFCNKICGENHFNMKMKIKVVDDAAYAAWLKNLKDYWPKPEGEKIAAVTNTNN